MWRRAGDENVDSGADTAESVSSRMSSSAGELMSRRGRQQRPHQLMPINSHSLANPGDSLLLQQTSDRSSRWSCPSLRIFHVSERASPFRTHTRICPVADYPSSAITFFLHEAYGEERILKVSDFFQRPPWQYHHTESCGSRTRGIHITSSTSPSNASSRPYLSPSRDFYSSGPGMPVWGVRPVHCGGEILRITSYSSYDNYEDAVKFYETVSQRQAEEQKAGFCWFTLHTEPGSCLQSALKQSSPGVGVEACSSAVSQFSAEEVGQFVPSMPNPCTPISPTRWQTEDSDGNKVLFQVKTPAQPQQPSTCAFPVTCLGLPPQGVQLRSSGHGNSFSPCSLKASSTGQTHRQGSRPRSEPVLEKLLGGCGGAESSGSGSCCSTPPGSSCYSSQRSSPAQLSTSNLPDSPSRPSVSRSLSRLLSEENEEETNVDTGAAVSPLSDTATKTVTRSSSFDLLRTHHSERPSSVEEQAEELTERLAQTHLNQQAPPSGSKDAAVESRTTASGQSPSLKLLGENSTTYTNHEEPVDEFFI